MPALRLHDLTKRFPNTSAPALDKVSLEVADGGFVALLGPSGCGKTTLLRLIAGLERPDSGNVFLGDRRVTDLPPRERDVAMVFQQDALYPHLSVYENIAFGLRVRMDRPWPIRALMAILAPARSRKLRQARAEIHRRVTETAEMLGLTPLLDRRPAQLSGGERRRTEFGRAIVRRPALFLFDEPLTGLDADLRRRMRRELKDLQRRLGTTTIYVTHDREEAEEVAQSTLLLRNGRLVP